MAYFAYGQGIESDVPLGVPLTAAAPETTISGRSEPVDQSLVKWFEPVSDEWCFGGRIGSEFYVLFEDEAEFVISADGSTIEWFSFTEVSQTLTHLVLDHILPRALTRQGSSALHGSCISHAADSCFAIVGQSGQGKSTLASALVARGHRFVADDCVVIDVVDGQQRARAAYPELRLKADHLAVAGFGGLVPTGDVTREGIKQRHAVPPAQNDPDARYHLTNVFVLGANSDPSQIVSAPLGPARAAIELLSNSFQLNDVDEQSAALARVAEIAQSCDTRGLSYDHSVDGLERTVQAIEQFLSITP